MLQNPHFGRPVRALLSDLDHDDCWNDEGGLRDVASVVIATSLAD
jgi:hypothetical protein